MKVELTNEEIEARVREALANPAGLKLVITGKNGQKVKYNFPVDGLEKATPIELDYDVEPEYRDFYSSDFLPPHRWDIIGPPRKRTVTVKMEITRR